MGLDKVWEDEASRAVEVLGGQPIKYVRTVDDKLYMRFTIEEWKKLFNVADDYVPCSPSWMDYSPGQPIQIYFVRRVRDEHT